MLAVESFCLLTLSAVASKELLSKHRDESGPSVSDQSLQKALCPLIRGLESPIDNGDASRWRQMLGTTERDDRWGDVTFVN